MANFDLQANEAVVLKAGSVMHGGGRISAYNDELILTNIHLIWLNKGMLGKVKRVEYFPLNQVKIFNDRAQALVAKSSGGSPQLEVFFQGSQEEFQFSAGGKREVAKWADAINRLVTGTTAEMRSSANMALPGTEAIAETLRDTFSQFKNAFGSGVKGSTPEIVRVATKCLSCGAQISGVSGTVAKCQYCDSECTMP